MPEAGADFDPRTATTISSTEEARRLKTALGAKDRYISGLALTWDGLTAHIAAGVVVAGGRYVEFGSQVDETLTATATNYIYAVHDGTIEVNQTGVAPANSVLLHEAVTDGSTVTGATDRRDTTLDFDVRINAFGADFESQEVTNVGTATAGTSAVNRNYVDLAVAAGSLLKIVRVASTTAVTLATALENGDTLDGVVLATNDVVLLTAQAAPAENGPWVVAASGAPTRPTYFDSSAEADALRGALFSAYAGTDNGSKVYKHTTTAAITLETTALVFTEVSVQGHAATEAAGIHGSTAANVANKLVHRNGSGQIAIGDGVNADHGVTKGQLDANATADRARANHTGTQLASTISDFDEAAQDAVGNNLLDTSTVDFTYNDGTGQISAIVPDDAISNAKMANMVQATVKGRASAAGTGDPTDLTAAQLITILLGADGAGSLLDADLLDGFGTAEAATASTVPVRTSAGRLKGANAASGDELVTYQQTPGLGAAAGNGVGFSGAIQPANIATSYAQPNCNNQGSPSATSTESLGTSICGAAFTLTQLHVRNPVGGMPGGTCSITVRKNGVDTALTVSYTGGEATNTLKSITGQSVSFAAGDRISMKFVTTQTGHNLIAWGIA